MRRLIWATLVLVSTAGAFAQESGGYDNKPFPRNEASAAAVDPAAGAAAARADWNVGQVALALGAVIVVILALRWGVRKFYGGAGAAGSSRALRIVSSWPVSPKQQLLLIHVGRRLLVAANNGTQMNVLCQIDDAEEVDEVLGRVQSEKGDSMSRSFKSMFSQAQRQFDGVEDRKQDAVDTAEMDAAVTNTRAELGGLMDKVRRLTRQFQHG